MDHFESGLDILAIQAPGRECRYLEKPLTSINEVVDELRAEIATYLDVPSFFVGHSNGALIAFELLRSLNSVDQNQVRKIVISAKRAPHLSRLSAPLHSLSLENLVQRLDKSRNVPPEILRDREMMEIYAPIIQADFSISENYRYISGKKLSTTPVLFWGAQDSDVPKSDILDWQHHFTKKPALYEFDGGHMFINSHQPLFIQRLNVLINQMMFYEASERGSYSADIPKAFEN